jgi:hypothetical protein
MLLADTAHWLMPCRIAMAVLKLLSCSNRYTTKQRCHRTQKGVSVHHVANNSWRARENEED